MARKTQSAWEIEPSEIVKDLHYNPATGNFTWARTIGVKAKQGNPAGGIAGGYVAIQIRNQRYQAHRLAWYMVHGHMPALIDHKNGNGLDNRIENLRAIDKAGNAQNVKRPPSNNTSGYAGVSWHKRANKWFAYIKPRNQRRISLGLFTSIENARDAYISAKIKHHAAYVP